MQINDFNPDGFRFPLGVKGEKAKEVMREVSEAADRMMNVDDRLDIDMDKRTGKVRVRNEELEAGRKYSGNMTYDPYTLRKENMEVNVEKAYGHRDESTLIYKKDHKDIPIFGSKKQLFRKETPDSIFNYLTHVQDVKVDHETGKVTYSEYNVDLSMPDHPPHHDPHIPPPHIPPSHSPSHGPSHTPSHGPSHGPSHTPSHGPSHGPSHTPSHGPSHGPSHTPSHGPSHGPSHTPSHGPSHGPSHTPSHGPSHTPSHGPSHAPSHGPGGPGGHGGGRPGGGPGGPRGRR